MYWNNKGTNVLLLTSTEVDKTGASYYGKQSLHFLSTKGDTAIVLLSKWYINYDRYIFHALCSSNNLFLQIKKVPFIALVGIHREKSSALFMASCLPKLLFLITTAKSHSNLDQDRGIPFIIILTEIISFLYSISVYY